jgi:D-3-phosphoglycerate dehydrogenase
MENNNMKILIGPSSFADQDRAPLIKLENNGYSVLINPFRRKITKEELMELLEEDVHGIIAGLETLDREVLENSRLKVISRCGAGISNVDTSAAKELGIRVYNTPFGPTRAVAELTMGCLLSLIRQVPLMDRSLHDGKWNKLIGRQLKGMKALIIGFGRIGQNVAQLLKAFEVDVMVCDPMFSNKSDVPYVMMNLEDALPQADIISLHASGSEQIIGPRQLSILKRGAFILNAARGEVIDESALADALDSGQVAGAWLDTFNQEPYNGVLKNYQQVILTPHVGSYTAEGRLQMELDAVENLIRGFREAGF